MKRSLILVLVASLALAVYACDDDPQGPPEKERVCLQAGTCSPTQRWQVLSNFEYAWIHRRIDLYRDLIDDEFVFYFSAGDVAEGLPEQLDRTEELVISSYIMDPAYPGPYRCRSIRVDMQFDKDTLVWIEVIPTSHPDEVWYSTTVFYNFTFEFDGDITMIARPGSRAQVTLRNVPHDGMDQWRLVEWRDLGSPEPSRSSAAGVEELTFGSVKGLYL